MEYLVYLGIKDYGLNLNILNNESITEKKMKVLQKRKGVVFMLIAECKGSKLKMWK